jgi:uncharacterized protein
MHGECGGSRRRFLQTTAATGAALASTSMLRAQDQPVAKNELPTVTLGRTGQVVTKLGMGTSWALSPSFVQAALLSGVRYIDTSESYENTRAEIVLGQVLERTGLRDQVYLVSKNNKGKVGGTAAAKTFEERLNASLERLKTTYVDCYYIHGVAGNEIALLKDPEVKLAFEKLKKAGKLKFTGISCHDAMLPEILETAAESGWIDQAMIQYNFRVVNSDKLQRAIDKASKANMGLVAMKTQKGAESYEDKITRLTEKGFKKEVAAIKAVWEDQRMQVVVSEMTTFSDLRENAEASKEPLTKAEARQLEEHRLLTANLYCHGCGHLCETAARGVPVATVLRYLRYYSAYGKRSEARALYQALPASARALGEADLLAAEKACPHGLPVVQLVTKADRLMS